MINPGLKRANSGFFRVSIYQSDRRKTENRTLKGHKIPILLSTIIPIIICSMPAIETAEKGAKYF